MMKSLFGFLFDEVCIRGKDFADYLFRLKPRGIGLNLSLRIKVAS